MQKLTAAATSVAVSDNIVVVVNKKNNDDASKEITCHLCWAVVRQTAACSTHCSAKNQQTYIEERQHFI